MRKRQADSVAPLPELEAHIGYWLRRVSNRVSGAFARSLAERQVSVAEWVALRHIHAGWESGRRITSGELSERLGMTRGAVSKIVEKLENKAWITRTTNPEDARMQWLALTANGEDALPTLARIADGNDEHMFGCLNTEEEATLRELLQKLARVHEWSDVPID